MPQEWAGPPQVSNLLVIGAHGGLHLKPPWGSEDTQPPASGEAETQPTLQARVLELQSKRLLDVCRGQGAHDVNVCPLNGICFAWS